MGYCKYLKAVCEKQERQARSHPAVRQISSSVSVTCPASVQLSPVERKVNDWMVLEDAYTPVFCNYA